MSGTKFSPGSVVATPGALAAFRESGDDPLAYLIRHLAGDWGDVDEHDRIPYIAMEYILGEELNELCRRGLALDRFLPLEHAVELIRQASAGMGYFHAKRAAMPGAGEVPLGIVHLDISPSNLLVTQDGFLKVIDFGIARAPGLHGGLKASGRGDVLPGKLGYMSPEQAARGVVDHRSDIFSLGIVLYEITVGKRLFRGPAADVVERITVGQVEPPTFVRRNYPPALESIVMRALEKHADDRYQSAYDLADDLESFLRDERLHSGPVRIARYLDQLTGAAGGARRPELISEAEARRDGDELDFDRPSFDAFVPVEGAPGPAQAPMWEDVEQPEADVAAALHLELAELRALRTPVPVRPAGMAPVRGASPPIDTIEDAAPPPPNAPPRARTSEETAAAPEPVPQRRSGRVTAEVPPPLVGGWPARPGSEHGATGPVAAPNAVTGPVLVPSAPVASAPVVAPALPTLPIGAAIAERKPTNANAAWAVAAALFAIVVGLVAYILARR